jgi:hypothetical protein
MIFCKLIGGPSAGSISVSDDVFFYARACGILKVADPLDAGRDLFRMTHNVPEAGWRHASSYRYEGVEHGTKFGTADVDAVFVFRWIPSGVPVPKPADPEWNEWSIELRRPEGSVTPSAGDSEARFDSPDGRIDRDRPGLAYWVVAAGQIAFVAGLAAFLIWIVASL